MEKHVAKDTGTFREISKIVLPSPCLHKAYKQMRLAAMQGRPALALLAGVEENNIFRITETLVPAQGSPRLSATRGLPAREWQRIRTWLQANACQLIAQIHSLPGPALAAGPNQTWSLIQVIGGISIIVPDFALGPSSPESWAVYRLASGNKWIALDNHQICHLFQIGY